jgi:hypothetical protein
MRSGGLRSGSELDFLAGNESLPTTTRRIKIDAIKHDWNSKLYNSFLKFILAGSFVASTTSSATTLTAFPAVHTHLSIDGEFKQYEEYNVPLQI